MIPLVEISIGLSAVSLALSIWAVVRAHYVVTTNHTALVAAASATSQTLAVNCATCKSAVTRFSLGAAGPLCANCRPLK